MPVIVGQPLCPRRTLWSVHLMPESARNARERSLLRRLKKPSIQPLKTLKTLMLRLGRERRKRKQASHVVCAMAWGRHVRFFPTEHFLLLTCPPTASVADDDAEFMIQCEICKVWQHGPCMGFAQESDIPQGDYYCEECRPEDHVELLRFAFPIISTYSRHNFTNILQKTQTATSEFRESTTLCRTPFPYFPFSLPFALPAKIEAQEYYEQS